MSMGGLIVANKRHVGYIGEEKARLYLEQRGFQIVSQNVYTPYGEIDLIGRKHQMLYFIEVKYRRSERYGTLRESITPLKLNRMKKSAHYFLSLQDDFTPFRISFFGIFEDKHILTFDFVEDVFA